MSAFLEAKALTQKAASGAVLLQDVSFELEKETVLAIAGPNGAGKTTLLNLLSGSVAPTCGDIWINGRSLNTLPLLDRARLIAVVGQHETPDSRLKLRDYVALGQIPIATDYARAEHAAHLEHVLNQTGLQTLANKQMGLLSGGERQRSHVARALVQRPSLLFLDEPTNHLDPEAKGKVLSLVANLGITVVMVVHDLVLIPEFATHVALLKDTQLAGIGPVSSILTPQKVHDTFGVEYLRFAHQGRMIPAIDIRRTKSIYSASTKERK